jgi:sulfur carrier protein ThiS
MKIRVHLFGTLPQRFPGYPPGKGLDLELSEGALVRDLLARMGITDSDGGIVTCGGRVMSHDDELEGGASVQVLQLAHGG